MMKPGSKPKVQSSWRLLLALLCISLVVAFGTIQAAHVHPQGDIPHPDCPLCATAHVGAEVASAPVTLDHVAPVISVVVVVVAPTLPPTLSTFALFTRPPPVDRVLA
jgi:DNA-binding helix-hairpin-helix protein with protein kinase domain